MLFYCSTLMLHAPIGTYHLTCCASPFHRRRSPLAPLLSSSDPPPLPIPLLGLTGEQPAAPGPSVAAGEEEDEDRRGQRAGGGGPQPSQGDQFSHLFIIIIIVLFSPHCCGGKTFAHVLYNYCSVFNVLKR